MQPFLLQFNFTTLMHPQRLFVFLIVYLFCVSGILCYEDKSNYRSCSLTGDIDTIGTYTFFMNTCALTEPNTTLCQGSYDTLQYVLASTTLGNIADFSSFITYFDWGVWMKSHNRVPMFYANTGLCPDIVHRVSEIPGVLEITLEDQSGSQSVANHAWCDQAHFNNSTGTCDNTTIWGQVPNYISPDTNEVFNYNGAAFYVPASEQFADVSFGVARVLIRSFQRTYGNGTVGDVPAYVPTSVFAAYEMPSLFANPNVTGIRVLVVTNQAQQTETCDSGSVAVLQNTISAQYGSATCLVDPPCVLYVVCQDNLNPAVNITNKEEKCSYFDALVEMDQNYSAICNCTTAWIDGASSSENDCPSVKDHSGVEKMSIGLWMVFIYMTFVISLV